jgi:hypothetical protein
VVPADFVMSRDMLHGVKSRAETLARGAGSTTHTSIVTGSETT